MCYAIIYPDDYVNIFAFASGLIVNWSAMFLGFIAIYQSKKFKKEKDKREETPILVVVPSTSSIPLPDVDIHVTHDDKECTEVTLLICSLNKTVSNFIVNRLSLNKNNEEKSVNCLLTHESGENSSYNGIFLPEKFYSVQISFPKPIEHCAVELEFAFRNIYFHEYYKIAIFKEKSNEWFLEKTLPCSPTYKA